MSKIYVDRITGEMVRAHKMVSAFGNQPGYAVQGQPSIFVPKENFKAQFAKVSR